jgi:hypothetical protein
MRSYRAKNQHALPGTAIACGAFEVQPMLFLRYPEELLDTFLPEHLLTSAGNAPKVGDPYFHQHGGAVVLSKPGFKILSVRMQCVAHWIDHTTYPLNEASYIDLSQMPDVIRRGTGMLGLSVSPSAFSKLDGGKLTYYRAVQVSPHTTIRDIENAIGAAEGWKRDDMSVLTNPETNVQYGPRVNIFDFIKGMRTPDKHIFCMLFLVPGMHM